MAFDEIGDRFKAYEACWDFTLPRRMPMVIRVDGRAFHSLKLEKPFDAGFWETMAATARHMCSQIQGARLAYFQSDEISIIARDDQSIQTQPWLGKRLSKILSLSAATATVAFNANVTGDYGGQFDARAFVLPSMDEVINYLIWRQQDAIRNSIQMLAQSVFSHKELHQKSTTVLVQMLREKGHEWEHLDIKFRRGCVVSPAVSLETVPETGALVPRRRWLSNLTTPAFKENREYLERLYEYAADEERRTA